MKTLGVLALVIVIVVFGFLGFSPSKPVVVPLPAPVPVPVPVPITVLKQEYSFSLTAEEPFVWRGPLNTTLDATQALPEGMKWNAAQGELTWKPTAGQCGLQRIGLTATTDGVVNQLALNLDVKDVAGVPEIRGELPATGRDGEALNVSLTVFDKHGLPTVLRLIQAPDGMTLSKQDLGWKLEWMPTKKQAGSNRVVLEAHNGQRVGTREVTIDIATVNHAPRIISSPVARGVRGAPYEYRIRALDPDDDPLVFELSSGPQGMTLDSKTGVLSWQPGADANAATVSFKVSDPRGASATQEFKISFAGLERVAVLGETLDGVAEMDDGLLCGLSHNRVTLFHPNKIDEPIASYWSTCRADRHWACHNGFVYLLNQGPVEILDAHNKNLLPVGKLDGQAHGIIKASISGKTYLVLVVQNTLNIYSLENPAQPQLKGSVELGFFASGLGCHENILYANGEQMFAAVDLQNPLAPKILGSVAVPKMYAGGIALKLPYIYAMDGHKLRILDVSNPAMPLHVKDCSVGGYSSNAVIEGEFLFGWGFNDSQCYSLTNELNPTRAEKRGFVGSAEHAYFQTADGRMVPWKERGVLKPSEPLHADSITICDKYAYVGGHGARVYDLSNPAQPRQVATMLTSGRMVPGDGRLYAPHFILDISNPGAPKSVGYLQGHAPMVVRGNFLYATYDKSLKLFNVSDPRKQVEIQTFPLDYKPQALYCNGDLLYASTGWDGRLCVYRITADHTLNKIADMKVTNGKNFITSFASEGDSLYVGLCGEGVAMLDVSHPEAPIVISRVATKQQAVDVTVCEPGLVAVADGCSGPLIIDFSVPKNARVLDSFPTSDSNSAIAAYKGYLYSCDSKGGLQVLQMDRKSLLESPVKAKKPGAREEAF